MGLLLPIGTSRATLKKTRKNYRQNFVFTTVQDTVGGWVGGWVGVLVTETKQKKRLKQYPSWNNHGSTRRKKIPDTFFKGVKDTGEGGLLKPTKQKKKLNKNPSFSRSAWQQITTLWIPGPLPLDSTASLHTSSRSQEVPQTPFRADPRYRPTSVRPPRHNHKRENPRIGAAPHLGAVGRTSRFFFFFFF